MSLPNIPLSSSSLPGADAENLVIGPGNVPKLAGQNGGIGLPQYIRQQREVVILGKNSPWAAIQLVQDLVGEDVVDRLVRLPVSRVKHRLDVGVVAEGPKRGVGKAVVVPAGVLFVQPDQPQGIRGVVGEGP